MKEIIVKKESESDFKLEIIGKFKGTGEYKVKRTLLGKEDNLNFGIWSAKDLKAENEDFERKIKTAKSNDIREP